MDSTQPFREPPNPLGRDSISSVNIVVGLIPDSFAGGQTSAPAGSVPGIKEHRRVMIFSRYDSLDADQNSSSPSGSARQTVVEARPQSGKQLRQTRERRKRISEQNFLALRSLLRLRHNGPNHVTHRGRLLAHPLSLNIRQLLNRSCNKVRQTRLPRLTLLRVGLQRQAQLQQPLPRLTILQQVEMERS